jgi:hypothetical protein
VEKKEDKKEKKLKKKLEQNNIVTDVNYFLFYEKRYTS